MNDRGERLKSQLTSPNTTGWRSVSSKHTHTHTHTDVIECHSCSQCSGGSLFNDDVGVDGLMIQQGRTHGSISHVGAGIGRNVSQVTFRPICQGVWRIDWQWLVEFRARDLKSFHWNCSSYWLVLPNWYSIHTSSVKERPHWEKSYIAFSSFWITPCWW